MSTGPEIAMGKALVAGPSSYVDLKSNAKGEHYWHLIVVAGGDTLADLEAAAEVAEAIDTRWSERYAHEREEGEG